MATKRAPKKAHAKIPTKTAERIVAIALQNPELGARRLVPLLKKKRINVSATSVQSILRRHNLQTRALRLAKSKTRKRKAKQKKPASRITAGVANRIVKLALKNPRWGSRRLASALAQKKVTVSPSQVYTVLKRKGLQTRQLRLAKLAKPSKKTRRPKSPRKKTVARISDAVAARIVEISLQNPDLGARRLMRLLQEEDIFASATSIYKILKRNNIENRPKRLLKRKEQQIPETPLEFEMELPEPVHVPAHLAPMPPEDEITESVQDQEELPSLQIEDEIWDPVLEPVESALGPDLDEIPEPLPAPAAEEMPEPVFEPAVAAPGPPAAEALLPVEEPVPEPAEVAPAEHEAPAVRKTLLKLPPQKSHWIFYPLYLLLLVLIGYLGFQAVQTVQVARLEADAASGPQNIRPDVQPQANIRPLSDYQVIWQRNLFNITLSKDSEKKEEISLDKIALAKKDLGLELVGTVVADNPYLSRAIIDNRKTREQEAYREGDSAGKIKIKKILRNNVIITTVKGDELLTVEIKESAKRSTASASSKSIGSRSSPSPRNSQSNARSPGSSARARSIKLKREEVEASLANVDAIMEKVKVTPYMQGDQPSGFRISNIPADSVLRKMGLRSRDVIVGIDDDDITGPDQASDFFEKLTAGEEVTIRVKRRRRTRQIKLNIE